MHPVHRELLSLSVILSITSCCFSPEASKLFDIKSGYVFQESFVIPSDHHIKELCCAHYNIELFIHQLKKIPPRMCMGKMEKGMEKLEKNCCILKKSSPRNSKCSKAETNFSRFKESLKEFLRWVNGISNCSSVRRSELGSYLDDKCSCPDLWKSHQGLGKEELPRH